LPDIKKDSYLWKFCGEPPVGDYMDFFRQSYGQSSTED